MFLCWFGVLLCFQGMLEPTKEPVKPVSAAEMIASIAQTPAAAPEKSSCPSDAVQVGPQRTKHTLLNSYWDHDNTSSVCVYKPPLSLLQQEALPPVQFDWSSSGLTNPLDGR